MSEEKKNLKPEEELEAVEDDDLGDVAGGLNVQINTRIKRQQVEKPGIPGLPNEETEEDAGGRLGVKR